MTALEVGDRVGAPQRRRDRGLVGENQTAHLHAEMTVPLQRAGRDSDHPRQSTARHSADRAGRAHVGSGDGRHRVEFQNGGWTVPAEAVTARTDTALANAATACTDTALTRAAPPMITTNHFILLVLFISHLPKADAPFPGSYHPPVICPVHLGPGLPGAMMAGGLLPAGPAGEPGRGPRTSAPSCRLAIASNTSRSPLQISAALLHRERLYHSHIECWREARGKGWLSVFRDGRRTAGSGRIGPARRGGPDPPRRCTDAIAPAGR